MIHIQLRQPSAGFDEPLQLPAAHRPLADLVGGNLSLRLGLLVATDQGGLPFPIRRLLLCLPGVLGTEVDHRLGVDGELLVEQPHLPLQLAGVGNPGPDRRHLRDVGREC